MLLFTLEILLSFLTIGFLVAFCLGYLIFLDFYHIDAKSKNNHINPILVSVPFIVLHAVFIYVFSPLTNSDVLTTVFSLWGVPMFVLISFGVLPRISPYSNNYAVLLLLVHLAFVTEWLSVTCYSLYMTYLTGVILYRVVGAYSLWQSTQAKALSNNKSCPSEVFWDVYYVVFKEAFPVNFFVYNFVPYFLFFSIVAMSFRGINITLAYTLVIIGFVWYFSYLFVIQRVIFSFINWKIELETNNPFNSPRGQKRHAKEVIFVSELPFFVKKMVKIWPINRLITIESTPSLNLLFKSFVETKMLTKSGAEAIQQTLINMGITPGMQFKIASGLLVFGCEETLMNAYGNCSVTKMIFDQATLGYCTLDPQSISLVQTMPDAMRHTLIEEEWLRSGTACFYRMPEKYLTMESYTYHKASFFNISYKLVTVNGESKFLLVNADGSPMTNLLSNFTGSIDFPDGKSVTVRAGEIIPDLPLPKAIIVKPPVVEPFNALDLTDFEEDLSYPTSVPGNGTMVVKKTS